MASEIRGNNHTTGAERLISGSGNATANGKIADTSAVRLAGTDNRSVPNKSLKGLWNSSGVDSPNNAIMIYFPTVPVGNRRPPRLSFRLQSYGVCV